MNDAGASALTEKQAASLQLFKAAVADVHTDQYDDHFYLRWLRARSYDVPKAEKMLRASLLWRDQMGTDSLLTSYNPPEVLQKYYPVGFSGHDRGGCPVLIIPFGNCDIKGILHSVKKSEYIKYTVYILEKSIRDMKEQSEKLGRNVDQLCIIFDLENFGMKHITWKPAMDVVLYLVQLHEGNYPEMMKKTYVVNTPKVFSIAYAIIRPFINDITASKIKIYGRGKPYKWRETLLADIDPNELPVHWGGSKTDENGDPRCPDLICLGGDVPQSYYMAPANRLAESEDLQMGTVNKGGTLSVEKEVPMAGSALRWEFKTEDYDIGFAVYRKQEDGSLVEVVPKQRVNSHLVPEDGQLMCTEPGTYVVTFDNTFSLFRPKKIAYTVSVLSPENVISGYDEIFGSGKRSSMTSLPNGPTSHIANTNGH